MAAGMNHVLFFGLGYSARTLAARLHARNWTIGGTSRSEAGIGEVGLLGYRGLRFDGRTPLAASAFEGVTHFVISVPPDEPGDPVINQHKRDFAARAPNIRWLAYLSTTGVYGDRGGDWVDEDSPLSPTTERGRRRLAAERQWLALHASHGLPVHIFRLAGIYGPGRNQFMSIAGGTARLIVKPGQVFSRIHVEDIATVLEASMARPNPGAAYNVCDDAPCPPQEVIAYAAQLLGRPSPPEIPFEKAELSPMARSFYAESKRVSNRRIKTELGVRLVYPDYRTGLQALRKDFTP
ncbi:MAG: SDR family oxidoreductase [Hyphomicrobiales bacterium]